MRMLVAVLLLLSIASAAHATSSSVVTPAVAPAPVKVTEIRYPVTPDNPMAYLVAMLTLALDETRAEYGAYHLMPVYDLSSQRRSLTQLSQNKDVDVMWTSTAKDKELSALPVRIPLFKGLMGYRLLVIRNRDRRRFDDIHSLAQLRRFKAGQVNSWTDTEILSANGIPVVASSSFTDLLPQLLAGRFDFLPLDPMEVFPLLAQHPELPLMVVPNITLFEPTAFYFFVNKNNTALAQRLHEGLRRAIDDGRFDQLFRHYPDNADALAKAQLDTRRVIKLDNPLLPAATPLGDKFLWFTEPNLPVSTPH